MSNNRNKNKNKKTLTSAEKLQQSKERILNENSPYAFKEAYVRLRTNLMFSLSTNGASSAKVIAMTSANPAEGKTTTTLNVAISFAMLGKKTLLIDADMRKPQVGRLLDTDSQNGLSNYLGNIGECYIHNVEGLPLDFITAGKTPPNPAELLSSASFEKMLEKFKEEYEYILIDTPPVNYVADAQIVAPHADGMVIVVRTGVTNAQDLIKAEESLKNSGGKLVGIVANDVLTKSGDYRYNKYKYKYYKRTNYEE